MDLMTAGIAVAAKNNTKDKYRWIKYSFPQRILLASRLKEMRNIRDDLAQVLAQHLHISTSTAKNEIIPLLKTIFTVNPLKAAKIALSLGLSEKIVEYLAGANKNAVLEYYRELKKNIISQNQFKHSRPTERDQIDIQKDNLNKGSKKDRDLFAFTKK
ncbi:MAG: replication factor C large subunit, partial [Ignisphaera sp.]